MSPFLDNETKISVGHKNRSKEVLKRLVHRDVGWTFVLSDRVTDSFFVRKAGDKTEDKRQRLWLQVMDRRLVLAAW